MYSFQLCISFSNTLGISVILGYWYRQIILSLLEVTMLSVCYAICLLKMLLTRASRASPTCYVFDVAMSCQNTPNILIKTNIPVIWTSSSSVWGPAAEDVYIQPTLHIHVICHVVMCNNVLILLVHKVLAAIIVQHMLGHLPNPPTHPQKHPNCRFVCPVVTDTSYVVSGLAVMYWVV